MGDAEQRTRSYGSSFAMATKTKELCARYCQIFNSIYQIHILYAYHSIFLYVSVSALELFFYSGEETDYKPTYKPIFIVKHIHTIQISIAFCCSFYKVPFIFSFLCTRYVLGKQVTKKKHVICTSSLDVYSYNGSICFVQWLQEGHTTSHFGICVI